MIPTVWWPKVHSHLLIAKFVFPRLDIQSWNAYLTIQKWEHMWPSKGWNAPFSIIKWEWSFSIKRRWQKEDITFDRPKVRNKTFPYKVKSGKCTFGHSTVGTHQYLSQEPVPDRFCMGKGNNSTFETCEVSLMFFFSQPSFPPCYPRGSLERLQLHLNVKTAERWLPLLRHIFQFMVKIKYSSWKKLNTPVMSCIWYLQDS